MLHHFTHRRQRLGIRNHVCNIVARRPHARIRNIHDFDRTARLLENLGNPQCRLHAGLSAPRQIRHIRRLHTRRLILLRQLFPLGIAVRPNQHIAPGKRRPIRLFPAVATAQPRHGNPALQIKIRLCRQLALFALDNQNRRIRSFRQSIQPEQRLWIL